MAGTFAVQGSVAAKRWPLIEWTALEAKMIGEGDSPAGKIHSVAIVAD